MAKALLSLGESNRAKDLMERVTGKNPEYMAGHDSLVSYHESVGDLRSAQHAIMKAVEKSPLRLDRQNRLGDIAFLNGDVATAERAYATVVLK